VNNAVSDEGPSGLHTVYQILFPERRIGTGGQKGSCKMFLVLCRQNNFEINKLRKIQEIKQQTHQL